MLLKQKFNRFLYKVMLYKSRDWKEFLCCEFLSENQTINSNKYCFQLSKLKTKAASDKKPLTLIKKAWIFPLTTYQKSVFFHSRTLDWQHDYFVNHTQIVTVSSGNILLILYTHREILELWINIYFWILWTKNNSLVDMKRCWKPFLQKKWNNNSVSVNLCIVWKLQKY